MRLISTIILLLNFTQVFSQSLFEDDIDRLFEHYDDQSPGVSVLVSKGNTILYKKDFGQANLEYGQSISSGTVFNATSLSKQFVAFGIYLLQKEGRLSFNDKVQDFLPDLPQHAYPVKIIHLLSHISGIRDQRGLLTLAGYRGDDFISNEDVLNLIIRQKGLNFEPGTQFQYSHSNYSLLAQVIESITGMSLNEYLKHKVFDPLEMDNTFFLDSSVKVIKDRAYSYEKINGTYNKINLNYQNYGPTNLMTTVDDLSKWIASLSRYTIAPKALISAFDAVADLNDGNKVIAADLGEDKILGCKGQFYREYKGFRFLSHGGSLGGFRSLLARFPDEKLSIVILSNENALNTYSAALSITDIVFALKDDSKEVAQPSNGMPEKIEEKYSENQEQYIGDYFNEELDTNIQLSVINEQLHISVGRFREQDLKFMDKDKFKANLLNEIRIEFLRNERNSIKGMNASSLGVSDIFFEKVDRTTSKK